MSCLLRIEAVTVPKRTITVFIMQQDNLTINLTIPTGWDTLDDYRLRYVFGLLAQGFPFAAGQDLLPFPLYIKGTVLAYYTLSGVLFIITHENYTRKGLFLYIFI